MAKPTDRPYPRDFVTPVELHGRDVVVFGTRPEAVKLATVIESLGERAVIVHTGQHYDVGLAAGFSAALGLRAPDHQLHIGGRSRCAQVIDATRELTELLAGSRARSVVVQGDTNSALGGALAATATGTPIVHVEAGLRSDDRAMPEEHNRVIIDHLSALACAPSEHAAQALARELGTQIHPRIVVTGNPVVDVLVRHRPTPATIERATARYDVAERPFVLATLHRPENVDDDQRLRALVGVLRAAPVTVIFAVHPRASRHLRTGRSVDGSIRFVDPLAHDDFIALLAACSVCVSDSGGVQEEVSVLGKPVIVVRRSTERPEVLGTFATLAPGIDDVTRELRRHLDDDGSIADRLRSTVSPYGTGNSGANIVAAMDSEL